MSPCQNTWRNVFFSKDKSNKWRLLRITVELVHPSVLYILSKIFTQKKKTVTNVESPAHVCCFTMLGEEGWQIYIQTASGNWFQLLGRPVWECRHRTGRAGFPSLPKAEEVRGTGPTLPPQPGALHWWWDQCWGLEPGSCWPSQRLTGTRTVPSSVGSRGCPDSGWPNRPDSRGVLGHKRHKTGFKACTFLQVTLSKEEVVKFWNYKSTSSNIQGRISFRGDSTRGQPLSVFTNRDRWRNVHQETVMQNCWQLEPLILNKWSWSRKELKHRWCHLWCWTPADRLFCCRGWPRWRSTPAFSQSLAGTK